MPLVLKQIAAVLAMMVLFAPFTFPQAKDTGQDNETLRQAAEKTGFWVGTTIQGRLWNHDPQYKPVMAREFNAGVSIVFQGITQPEHGRFNFDGMDEAKATLEKLAKDAPGNALPSKS